MKLQGNVNTRLTKGAIWQELIVFGELLKGFEEARQRHLPAESQVAQDLPKRDASLALSPPLTQGPSRPINNQRRPRASVGKASARATVAAAAPDGDIATPAASQIIADNFAQSQIDERFNFLPLRSTSVTILTLLRKSSTPTTHAQMTRQSTLQQYSFTLS
jgi:hypothetical protein